MAAGRSMVDGVEVVVRGVKELVAWKASAYWRILLFVVVSVCPL